MRELTNRYDEYMYVRILLSLLIGVGIDKSSGMSYNYYVIRQWKIEEDSSIFLIFLHKKN